MTENREYSFEDLLYLMSRLRDPLDGCPWDQQQDFASIAPYTIEESYELADAIASGDFGKIREELGDVLFQVVFYAQLGQEQQRFDFAAIVSGLVAKLVKRHPHVFPEGTLDSRTGRVNQDSGAVKQTWEALKAAERGARDQHSAMDDVPVNLPALSRAAKLQKRAAREGFDWQDPTGAVEKIKEEVVEFSAALSQGQQQATEQELGDILFSCVNLARHLGINPESALRGSNQRFEQRFRYIEHALERENLSSATASLEAMDKLWDEAKAKGL